ncbi:MAG: succinate dehydrogenase, hydrophobic membrane anchor protein [Gammaproteobacteria bacterium]|nr:succinate dehydrogenase, hydrophobic membrane anchor protein [Gammaproteobacteria bacterium]
MSAAGLQGLRPWIIQRISAAYLAVFVIYFPLVLFIEWPLTAQSWQDWVASPFNNIALGLFLIALLWHAWIGIRDVILDYVFNVVVRMIALTLVAMVVLGSGYWGFRVLAGV